MMARAAKRIEAPPTVEGLPRVGIVSPRLIGQPERIRALAGGRSRGGVGRGHEHTAVARAPREREAGLVDEALEVQHAKPVLRPSGQFHLH